MLQIAEKPPDGLLTPADLVVCPVDPADGPLFCRTRPVAWPRWQRSIRSPRN